MRYVLLLLLGIVTSPIFIAGFISHILIGSFVCGWNTGIDFMNGLTRGIGEE